MGKSPALQIASGQYTGTGSAVNIVLGFKPRRVEIFNVTDGDAYFLQFEGMDDGDSISIVGAVSQIADNGIKLVNNGFVAGSDCSENAKVFKFLAQE